jgi:DNA-directed RNA polymerase specialized sigma24 family protein
MQAQNADAFILVSILDLSIHKVRKSMHLRPPKVTSRSHRARDSKSTQHTQTLQQQTRLTLLASSCPSAPAAP